MKEFKGQDSHRSQLWEPFTCRVPIGIPVPDRKAQSEGVSKANL
jgi:hypothetical protein